MDRETFYFVVLGLGAVLMFIASAIGVSSLVYDIAQTVHWIVGTALWLGYAGLCLFIFGFILISLES